MGVLCLTLFFIVGPWRGGGTLVSFKLYTVILLVVTFHLGKLRHRKMK